MKSPLIIVGRDDRIGDAICAFPAIHALVEQFREESDVYLALANRDVGKIMKWREGVQDLFDCHPPFAYGQPDVFVLQAYASIAGEFRREQMHLTQHFFAWAGLDVPEMPPQPELIDGLEPNDKYPAYDYVVAPWSKDPARGMTTDEAGALLAEIDPRETRIAILGAVGDPWPTGPFVDSWYIEREYGRDLADVVRIMRACKKAVITTDSACNRLAHAAGILNHALIAKALTPLTWQMHPKASVVYAEPHQWRTRDLLAVIEAAEQEKAKAEAVPA